MRVKVTAHEKFLIIETVEAQADEDFIPAGGSKIGCLLFNPKKHLGISEEAMNLIKGMKRGGDDLGDLTLFESEKRGQSFGWLGGVKELIDTTHGECELSRDSLTDIEHIIIENNIPIAAFEAITRMGE